MNKNEIVKLKCVFNILKQHIIPSNHSSRGVYGMQERLVKNITENNPGRQNVLIRGLFIGLV